MIAQAVRCFKRRFLRSPVVLLNNTAVAVISSNPDSSEWWRISPRFRRFPSLDAMCGIFDLSEISRPRCSRRPGSFRFSQ